MYLASASPCLLPPMLKSWSLCLQTLHSCADICLTASVSWCSVHASSLSCCRGRLGHLIKRSYCMLFEPPVLFLRWQVEMSAVKKTYCVLALIFSPVGQLSATHRPRQLDQSALRPQGSGVQERSWSKRLQRGGAFRSQRGNFPQINFTASQMRD